MISTLWGSGVGCRSSVMLSGLGIKRSEDITVDCTSGGEGVGKTLGDGIAAGVGADIILS